MSNNGRGRTLPSQTDADTGKVLGTVDVEGPDNGAAWVEAGAAAFTPTTSADWGSSVPTTIQEALDTIAANITIP